MGSYVRGRSADSIVGIRCGAHIKGGIISCCVTGDVFEVMTGAKWKVLVT